MKKGSLFGIFLLIVYTNLAALEKAPWFGNDNEIEWRTTYAFGRYDDLDNDSTVSAFKARDHHLALSIGVATMGKYHSEVELQGAYTGGGGRNRLFDLEGAVAAGRWLLMNDIIGDPVSLTTGVALAYSPNKASKNSSLLRHAPFEAELHFAVGREVTSRATWSSRWWGFGACTFSSKGNPRAEGFLTWEKNFQDKHRLGFFGDYLYGLGSRKLSSIEQFDGYRSLGYRTFKGGIAYTYVMDVWGEVTAKYSRSFYEKYMPEDRERLSLQLFLPFGL